MAAVDLFYRKVLDDQRTKPFFSNLDMDAQVRKQVSFLTWAFGGPAEQRGRNLRDAHAKLRARGLSDEHFDAVAQLLEATLVELNVQRPLIDEAMAIVAGTRSEVLGR